MNIRTITGFLNLFDPISDSDVRAFRTLIDAARADFREASAGFPIQTARLATQSLAQIAPQNLPRFARDLESVGKSNQIDYVSMGALPGDHPLIEYLAEAIAGTENVFGTAHIASHADGINLKAITSAARVVCQLANSTADGFGNLRFAALANCPPHSPFFPVAYHDGGARAFAIATEAAPLAVDAFSRAQSLAQARENLVDAVERASETISRIANDLAKRFDFRFAGIDFSLAPYPEESRSVGTAMEQLTGAKFGERGTLFAAAFLTDCLNRANFPRTGFSGLMLPVLEDSTLAARSANYTLDSLLLYSTVCGTGLDTIPLSGDTTSDTVAGILLDLATLAVKLNKPLTARLMPIPGMNAGDTTRFNFEYFANARVMDSSKTALKIFETDDKVEFKIK
ncbi:MAG: DUF711 family protein [Chloroflexi bacterium]|nr:DUF711 family protein [Chloroflexota bacterium]